MIDILQVISGSIMTITILMQQRSSGLSAVFGGTGSTQFQRRGAEKLIYSVSVWSAVFFFALSILRWYL